MSNYGMHPRTEGNYRRQTGWDSCPGVMSPSFICKKCNQDKKTAGRKQVVKGTNKYGFICADCQQAPSMFSALLLGDPIKLPKGKARVVTFKTKEDKDTCCGERERLANLEKIRDSIRAGICTRAGLHESTGLSFMTLSRRLAELIDAGEVMKVRAGNQYEWRFK